MPQNPGESQAPDGAAAPRLQTHMARLGIASRRHSAELIKAGDVLVNGVKVLEPGYRVQNPGRDVLTVRGRVVAPPRGGVAHRTIMLNKPAGLVCSSSDRHGPTVFECLHGIRERLVCVGRLDRDSEGLLLLSNDGDLVNRLTHPRYGHRKEYHVVASGPFDERTLKFLNSSMVIDGYRIRPAQVDYLERLADGRHAPRHLLRFFLGEGRNRQIRNMCEQAGLRVQSLVRTAINDLRLPRDLRPGQWRDLRPDELERL
jgi:23S rRNA pseudouridine2605 synthase